MIISDVLLNNALAIACPFVQKWEAFKSHPYLCPTGHWTIGFGSTSYPDGTSVTQHDAPISLSTAIEMAVNGMRKEAGQISFTRVPTAHQLAAILAFAYNVGAHGADHSTLMHLFNQGFVNAAAAHFMDWDKGRDKNGTLIVINGLLNRRMAESAMFQTPDSAP